MCKHIKNKKFVAKATHLKLLDLTQTSYLSYRKKVKQMFVNPNFTFNGIYSQDMNV